MLKLILKELFIIYSKSTFPPAIASTKSAKKHCNDQLQLYAEHGSDSIKAQQGHLSIKKHQCASSLQLRRKAECPLNGDCRKKAIVYKASIPTVSNDPPKSYYGCCQTKFKSRFYNYCQTFKNKQKRYTTELSKAF